MPTQVLEPSSAKFLILNTVTQRSVTKSPALPSDCTPTQFPALLAT